MGRKSPKVSLMPVGAKQARKKKKESEKEKRQKKRKKESNNSIYIIFKKNTETKRKKKENPEALGTQDPKSADGRDWERRRCPTAVREVRGTEREGQWGAAGVTSQAW